VIHNSSSEPQDFVWSARVTSEARDVAAVHVRHQRFLVGRALDFDRESDSVSALEYLLGALGADLLNGLRTVARRRRIQLDRVEATVEGRLGNPLVHLAVVGEEGSPGLASARVKVYASSLDPEERLRDAWGEALERSPIAQTLRAVVELSVELHLVD
jgi:uncharacterized OsmC-like protein